MPLTNEEKGLIEEALNVYLQLISQQLPRQQVQQVAVMAQGVINKLDSVGTGAGGGGAGGRGNKPAGISDEWYDNVCISCENLDAAGCGDKVTLKFPGKCDPILHYERAKTAMK
jgi:hypothetical protein